MKRLICAVVGHDLPRDGTISQQCRRCGAWWNYDDEHPIHT